MLQGRAKEGAQVNILIYTKPGCPNCDTAAALLVQRGLPFTEVDIEQDPARLQALVALHPQARQMPQVFIDGQRVGGLAGMQAALAQLEGQP